MELSRRDALVAVAASGVGVGGAGAIADRLSQNSDQIDDVDGELIDQLQAVAAVIYPSEVTPTEEFIRTYLLGRLATRDEHVDEISTALSALNKRSRRLFGSHLTELSAARAEHLLRTIGVDTVTPDPAGTVLERIRYYVVDELLYALYSTPVGGRLFGHETPLGYPGGLDAYQRGPDG